jgi:hypothetical protein
MREIAEVCCAVCRQETALVHQRSETTHSEPSFRALLTEGAIRQVEAVKP